MSVHKKAKQRSGQVDPVAVMKVDTTAQSNQVRFASAPSGEFRPTAMKEAGRRKLPAKIQANY